MGRTRLPEHITRLIPAAERSQPKPKRQIDQNRKLTASMDGASILRAAMSESDFQKAVLAKARDLGWTVWHDAATNAPRVCYACRAPARGPRNASGLPDLILVRGARLIWAELKSQDGVTSPEQRQWIAALRAAGQQVYVWRPSQWDSIVEVLT